MARALLCCLLILLAACTRAPTPAPPAREAPAPPTATVAAPPPAALAPAASVPSPSAAGGLRPCPAGMPVRGVGSADGSLWALLPGDADYDRLPWLRCFAALAEAEAAGFARPAAGAVAPGTGATAATPAREELAVVTRVIDGHTIEVRLPNGRVEIVRYLGVAAPEPAECQGTEAQARNQALVGGRTVRLERDTSDRDRNERLLRYVWVVGDDGATRLANEEQARAGFAAAAILPPDRRYEQRLLAAEREAREAGRGLWASCAALAAPSAPPSAASPPPAPPTPTVVPPTSAPTRPAPTAPAPPPAPTPTQRVPTATTAPALPTATRVPPTPTRTPTPPPAQACHPSYPTLCLPGSPDLDCKDIPQRNFPVRPPDPHRFDADKDGIGCEE